MNGEPAVAFGFEKQLKSVSRRSGAGRIAKGNLMMMMMMMMMMIATKQGNQSVFDSDDKGA